MGVDLHDRLKLVERKIGYCFSEWQLLLEALTHRSYAEEHQTGYDYERLEYLGDALLSAYVSERLYHEEPDSPPGQLSVKRSNLVNGKTLAAIVAELGLCEFVFVAAPLRDQQGHLVGGFAGDFFEALVAAIYLDGGVPSMNNFLCKMYKKMSKFASCVDYKSMLQDFFLKNLKKLPVYDTIHNEIGFKATVDCDRFTAVGEGPSKKQAEQKAAKNALEALK